jgi:hypothetical protein
MEGAGSMSMLSRLFGTNASERQDEEIAVGSPMTADELHEGIEPSCESIVAIKGASGQYYYCGICGWVHISHFPNCH